VFCPSVEVDGEPDVLAFYGAAPEGAPADLPDGQRLLRTQLQPCPHRKVTAYFLHIFPDRTSNLATGRSICQSSTSWLTTSLSAQVIADSSSAQSIWIILIGRLCSPTINAR
jgi:hypothetical protein